VKSVAKDMNKFVRWIIAGCFGLGAGIVFWVLWGHNLSVSMYMGWTDENGKETILGYITDEVSFGLKLFVTALIGIVAFLLVWFLVRFWGRKTQEREIVH
jgi:hypothetical protein